MVEWIKIQKSPLHALSVIKRSQVVIIFCIAIMLSGSALSGEKYTPEWDSIFKHKIPEWMLDAKFGIYGHWGPYAVAFDWDLEKGMEITRRCVYFNFMYRPGSDERTLFEKNIGPISKGFGYKDLIKKFTAKKFNPARWADIIARSGAKFAGIALMHHDGYALWDSDLFPWSSGKTGPRRDAYGELVKELRKKGLKTIATFHHFRTHKMWQTYYDKKYLETAKKENWDLLDPKYRSLYWYNTDFEKDFLPSWRDKIKEVIDKYRPDIIWCDGANMRVKPVDKYALEWVSYYFNKAEEWGKEVCIHNKCTGKWGKTRYNFGNGFGIYQYENGRNRPDDVERPWENGSGRTGMRSIPHGRGKYAWKATLKD